MNEIKPLGNSSYFPLLEAIAEVEKGERNKSLEEAKATLLGSPSLSITMKQFLLLHGDTFVASEGGNLFANVDYMIKVLELWKKNEELINTGLSKEEIAECLQDYYDIKEYNFSLKTPSHEERAGACRSYVCKKLKTRGRCVLPIQISAKSGDFGHDFICLFIKDKDGNIICHLLNKGDGARFHPLVDISDTKFKLSYRFFPIQITKTEIFNDEHISLSFFKHLLAYSNRCPTSAKPYDLKEVYALFLMHGEILTENLPSLMDKATQQRKGTCSMQSLPMLLRFNMAQKEDTQLVTLRRKQMKFAIRFRSLLDVLQSLAFKRRDQAQLRMVLQGFCVSIEKHYPAFLSDEELFLCRALAEILKEKLEALEKQTSPAPLSIQVDHPPTNIVTVHGRFPETVEGEEKHIDKYIVENPVHPLDLTLIDDPKTINRFLLEAIDFFESLSNQKNDYKSTLVAQIFARLPVPNPDQKKGYWDHVSKEEISEVISRLFKLSLIGLCAQENQINLHDACLISLTAYAAIHRLCMRLPHLKLNEFAMFAPFQDGEDFFFPIGQENNHYKQIKSYFKKHNKGKVLLVDFYRLNNFLESFKNAVDVFERDQNAQQKMGILSYINKFLYNQDDEIENTAHRYALTWEKSLPSEFYILQTMASIVCFKQPCHLLKVVAHREEFEYCEAEWTLKLILNDLRGKTVDDFVFLHVPSDHFSPSADKNIKIPFLTLSNENELSTYQPLLRFAGMGNLYLRDADQVRLAAILTWLKQNPGLLENKAIQKEIKKLLLSRSDLEYLTPERFHLIEHLRAFLDTQYMQMLQRPKKVETAFFWLQLSYEIETYMLCIEAQKNIALERIQEFRNFTKRALQETTLNKEILFALQIYFHCHETSLEDEETHTMLTSSFLKRNASPYLNKKTDAFMQMQMPDLQKRWEANPDLKERGLEGIAREYSLAEEWEGTFPYYTCGNYGVDVSAPCLTYAEIVVSDHPNTLLRSKIDIFFDIRDEIKVLSSGSRKAFFYFADQTLEIRGNLTRNMGDLTFYADWSVDHETLTYTKDDRFGELLPQPLSMQGSIWRSIDSKKQQLLLIDRNRKPIARFLACEKVNEHMINFIVQKLNKKGMPTGETLCFLDTLDFFPMTDLKRRCLMWQKEGKISSFDIPDFGLSFYEKEGMLFHSDLNFYIASEQRNPLNHNEIAFLMLEKKGDEKEKRFILLKEFTVGSGERFLKGTHFIYHQDKFSGMLTNKDPVAMLFLITCLVKEGDYSSALDYLDQLNSADTYTKDARICFDLIFQKPSKDPLQSSFRLHAALNAIENEELLTQAFFEGNSYFLSEQLLQKIADDYGFVLSIMSSSSLHRIPERFALSIEMRRKLIQYLEERKQSLSPLLKKECTFFIEKKSFEANAPLTMPTFHLNVVSDILGTLDKKNYNKQKGFRSTYQVGQFTPHQIRAGNLVQNFFAYYQYFKEEPSALMREMELLTLLASSNRENEPLTMLLSLVSRKPDCFPQVYLKAKQSPGYEEHLEDHFASIVNSACRLRYHPITLPQQIIPPPKQKLSCQPPTILSPYSFPIPSLSHPDNYPQHPLGHLRQEYYTKTTQSPHENGAFFETEWKRTPLEEKLFTSIKKGHVQNCAQEDAFYDFQDTNLDTLEEALKGQIKSDQKACEQLKINIEKIANQGFDDSESGISVKDLLKANREQLRLLGEKREHLTLHNHLYEAFLLQDAAKIKCHNPALQEADIENIFNQMLTLMLIASRIDQANQAKEYIKKIADSENHKKKAMLHQELATILDKERFYDATEHPIFLLYEYATSMMLRKEQVELLQWIFREKDVKKRRQLLVEFQAGGGKTKIISTLLCYYAIKQGLIPVFFSLPSLSDLTKEDLKDSLSLLRIRLKRFEISLQTLISYEQVNSILARLDEWHKQGVALHMTPEVFHALHLHFQCTTVNSEHLADLYIKLMTFWEEKAFFIIDEAHRNISSTELAIVSVGEGLSLKDEERSVFVICYQALTGSIDPKLRLEDGREVHTLLNLRDNKQAMLQDKDREDILKALASYLVDHPSFNIPQEQREQIARYLYDKEMACPIASASPRILLARGLITEVLKPVLSMVHLFDYGASIRDKDEIESPRFQKNPTVAQFESADISSALCCQGLYQRGLNPKQMKTLVTQLYNECKGTFIHHDDTQIFLAKTFLRWQEEGGMVVRYFLSEFDLQTESEENEHTFSLLAHSIGKHHEVIEHYLSYHLLKQVKVYAETYKSMASDLVDGNAFSISFSATMGMSEQYPTNFDLECRFDFAFMAAFIARASANANSELLWFSVKESHERSPQDLFNQLWKEWGYDKKRFGELRGLIDSGGWNKDFSTEESALAILDFARKYDLDYDGSLFIRETESLSQPKELVYIKQSRKGIRKRYMLKGSNVLEGLERAGFEHPEKLRIFRIYGPGQCEGTDLYIDPDAKMIQTFGESSTLYSGAQAFLRPRQILKPVRNEEDFEWMQRIVWVGPEPLKNKVGSNLILWLFKREVEEMEPRILARAQQGIVRICRKHFWKKIKEKQIPLSKLREQYPLIYKEIKERDLAELYCHPDAQASTEKVLNTFKETFCKKTGIELSEEENEKIQELIIQTVALIPLMKQASSASKETMVAHQIEHSQQKDKEKEKNVNRSKNVGINLEKRETAVNQQYLPGLIKKGALLNGKNQYIIPARSLFNTTLLSQDLYFLHNAVATYADKGLSQLKSILFFILVVTKSRKFVYACTVQDAQSFSTELQKLKSKNCQMALMTPHGIIETNGKGSCIVSSRWMEENESWLKQMLTQLAFCNGKVYEPSLLKAQIETWKREQGEEKLSTLWDQIESKQMTPENVQKALIIPLLTNSSSHKAEDAAPTTSIQRIDSETIHAVMENPSLIKGRLFQVAGTIVLLFSIGGGLTFFFLPIGPMLTNSFTVAFVVTVGAGIPVSIILFIVGTVINCRRKKNLVIITPSKTQ